MANLPAAWLIRCSSDVVSASEMDVLSISDHQSEKIDALYFVFIFSMVALKLALEVRHFTGHVAKLQL